MSRKLEFLRTLLRMLFQFLFAIILTHVYYVAYVDKPIAPECVGTILLYFLLAYSLDFFVVNLPVKLAIHIGMIASAIALPYVVEVKVFLVIVLLGISNATILGRLFKKKKANDKKTPVPIAYMLVILFVNLYAYNLNSVALIRTCNLLPIIMLFIYLLQVYLDGLGNYINLTTRITGVPIKRIVFTNSTFIGGIMFSLMIVVIILNIFGVDGSTLPIWKGFASAILLIFCGILFLFGSFLNKFTDGGKEDESFLKAKRVLQEEGTNKLGDVLEMLLFIAVIIAVIYVLYKMIFYFVKLLLSKRQNVFDSIERADAIADVAEERSSTVTKFEAQSSEEEKVRKLYKQRIMKQKHFFNPSAYKTVRDYEREASEQSIGDISDATELYSRVRYGNEVVDKTTVKEMKTLLKK